MQQLKSSVQKGIRNKLIEQYPHIEGHIDQVLPKKDSFRIVKWYGEGFYVGEVGVT